MLVHEVHIFHGTVVLASDGEEAYTQRLGIAARLRYSSTTI